MFDQTSDEDLLKYAKAWLKDSAMYVNEEFGKTPEKKHWLPYNKTVWYLMKAHNAISELRRRKTVELEKEENARKAKDKIEKSLIRAKEQREKRELARLEELERREALEESRKQANG